MTDKVRVTADQSGNIIGVSQNNPEYGYIRVEQVCTVINNEGWLRKNKRSALIKGKIVDLVDTDFTEGQEIDGKIIVVESHVPFNPENPERDLKVAGDTGIVCRVDDMPIYRQSYFTPNLSAQDELIMHTNTQEIREVLAATRAIESLKDKEVATL